MHLCTHHHRMKNHCCRQNGQSVSERLGIWGTFRGLCPISREFTLGVTCPVSHSSTSKSLGLLFQLRQTISPLSPTRLSSLPSGKSIIAFSAAVSVSSTSSINPIMVLFRGLELFVFLNTYTRPTYLSVSSPSSSFQFWDSCHSWSSPSG